MKNSSHKPSSYNKWKYTLITTFILFLFVNPFTMYYLKKCTNFNSSSKMTFNNFMKNCYSYKGIFLLLLFFTFCLRGVMELKI